MIQIALLCLKMIKLDSGAELPAWSVSSKLSTILTISSSLTAIIWNESRFISNSYLRLESLKGRYPTSVKSRRGHNLKVACLASKDLNRTPIPQWRMTNPIHMMNKKEMTSIVIRSLRRRPESLVIKTPATPASWNQSRKILSSWRVIRAVWLHKPLTNPYLKPAVTLMQPVIPNCHRPSTSLKMAKSKC